MSAIILLEANDAQFCEILTVEGACDIDGSNLSDVDDWGGNKIFDSVEDADNWIQKHARVGWCTRILDIDA